MTIKVVKPGPQGCKIGFPDRIRTNNSAKSSSLKRMMNFKPDTSGEGQS